MSPHPPLTTRRTVTLKCLTSLAACLVLVTSLSCRPEKKDETGGTKGNTGGTSGDDGDTEGGPGGQSPTEEVRPSNFMLPGELVVTEIMANPQAVSDATGEWFEIYNPTSWTFDLLGLELAIDGGVSITVEDSTLIRPNSYIIFGGPDAERSTGGIAIDYEYSGLTLKNLGSKLVISVGGNTLDEVVYGTAPDGASLSLSVLNAIENDDLDNWCAASVETEGDRGTPGSANPSCE